MRIVFMGTPEFAVPGLKSVVEAGYEVAAVVTSPDRPRGRGKKMQGSAVKEYALQKELPVLQPANLKDAGFLRELRGLGADLFIVVAFRMLPREVWQMPPRGTFNLHASLLPDYRGAAPIHWAVINGEKRTGLTTFFLKHEIDTGDIILQEEEEITSDDTTGSLYLRLMHKGAALVLKTVQMIENDKVELKPQKITGQENVAPKLTRENTEINWGKSAEQVRNHIRGLNPVPGAWTHLNDSYYKIFEAERSERNLHLSPGVIHSAEGRLWVGCQDQPLEIIQLQAEGKRRMTASDYLAGNKM